MTTEIQQVKQRFGIIGDTPELIQAISRAMQIAPIDDVDVLITGESGAGKEFFPQIIHAYSIRKHNKYIAVNCGAIPEGTIDSELFGHEKGAFTGAISSRKGYFEEADGGTIFLDEVGELPLTTQARLLRVLESGEFIRVGSSAVYKTNARVVAATNLDMLKAISEGRFREDLYYRLNTVHIEVPPLRERPNDIILLFRKFASEFAEKYRMPVIRLTDDARHVLTSYRWPGNVRQLKNIARQVSIYETSREVTGEMLVKYLPQYTVGNLPALRQDVASSDSQGSNPLLDNERKMIYEAIIKMQKEIKDLRDIVNGLLADKESAVVETMPRMIAHPTGTTTHISYPHQPYMENNTIYNDIEAEEIMVNEYEEHPTSLEDTERETIRRALARNNGKRKKTAQELQISERTLYRKIKEYNLE
ncbi:MAG: sigma-54-dependent Fis family transcriptional regulator [Bacteroidaceae bacterium]|nr:sigma-54-dependent Fis family transcriptional regulator [Bacteroidaceae bacterium]MBQ2979527.1 sigma-54-dependent Fis family transcriptional regulator [Bacteroidaceae bacterium]